MNTYGELLRDMQDNDVIKNWSVWFKISNECIEIEDKLVEKFVLSTGHLPTSREEIRINDFNPEYWDEDLFNY